MSWTTIIYILVFLRVLIAIANCRRKQGERYVSIQRDLTKTSLDILLSDLTLEFVL